MKLKHILRRVGSRIISEVIPGGGLLLDLVNTALPDKHKLEPVATGTEVERAIASLPPPQRAQLLEREHDVRIVEFETVQAMLQAETQSKQTTRPAIAKGSFQVIAASTLGIVASILVAVWKTEQPLTHLADLWPVFLAILSPLTITVHSYFGRLTTEHKNRLDAAGGFKTDTIGLINKLFKK